MEKILITGVAGFIGSKVATRFQAEGYYVIGIDDLSVGSIKNVPKGIEFIKLDLASKGANTQIPQGCTKVLHLAGQSSGEISFDDPVADLEKNTVSTLNIIKYGIDSGAERLVYASSMSVYGNVFDKPAHEKLDPNPLSCYGVGKLAGEGYLRVYQKSLPYVALRMFNVYGPGQNMNNLRQGMVSIFLAQALEKGLVKVKGSLARYRDFIYIDDVVEAWFRASFSSKALNQAINVGTGHKTTVDSLLKEICCLVPSAEYHVEGSTPGDQNGIYADTGKLNNKLDFYSHTTISEGLPKFVEWAKSIDAKYSH